MVWWFEAAAMAWWFGVAAMVDSFSFTHSDSLSHIICGFWFALNFCCGSLRSAWIGYQNWQQGLKIGGDNVVVWRSTAMAWWFAAVAMVYSLSFSHSDPLFLSLRFSLSDWMWVLVLL